MKSYSMPNSELKVKAITFKFMFRPGIIYTISIQRMAAIQGKIISLLNSLEITLYNDCKRVISQKLFIIYLYRVM